MMCDSQVYMMCDSQVCIVCDSQVCMMCDSQVYMMCDSQLRLYVKLTRSWNMSSELNDPNSQPAGGSPDLNQHSINLGHMPSANFISGYYSNSNSDEPGIDIRLRADSDGKIINGSIKTTVQFKPTHQVVPPRKKERSGWLYKQGG
ncbi:hypothetical protein ACJMK2_032748 [Sinanodonta woodiana]|uniref:B box-type domain-containing protein n=1 Tax=Sinanodonta woodiana TaxID=1069815 RepID=A0ABD3X2R5_SINWO